MTQQAKIDPSTCLRLIKHALFTTCRTESAIVSQAVCSLPPVNIATHPLRGQSQQPGSPLSTQSKDSVLAVQQELLSPSISQPLTTVNEDTNTKKQPDTTEESDHDLTLAMAEKEYEDAIRHLDRVREDARKDAGKRHYFDPGVLVARRNVERAGRVVDFVKEVGRNQARTTMPPALFGSPQVSPQHGQSQVRAVTPLSPFPLTQASQQSKQSQVRAVTPPPFPLAQASQYATKTPPATPKKKQGDITDPGSSQCGLTPSTPTGRQPGPSQLYSPGAKPNSKYYVVIAGRRTGVYASW